MASDDTATVTSKGQITIPKHVRDRLDLKPGDKVRFEIEGDAQARMTAMNRSLEDLIGILKPKPGIHVTVEEMKDSVRDAAAERARKGLDRD